MRLIINAVHQLNQSHNVRSYNPTLDQPAILDICKNVYGGSDRLPQKLPSESTKPNTAIVVATDYRTDLVNAIACSKYFPNYFIWVWGVRTRESMAGQGLATQLLSHIEELWKKEAEERSSSHPPPPPTTTTTITITTIVTTTIPSNKAMLKILGNLNYILQRHVAYWPPWPVVETISKGEQTLKDIILPSASPAALQLAHKWRPAASISDLESFLIEIRTINNNTKDGEDSLHNNNNTNNNKLLSSWLPHDYSVYPCYDGSTTSSTNSPTSTASSATTTASRRVFILDDDDDANNRAVVIINQGYVEDLWFAGIVATSPVALEAAALKAVDIEPGCAVLYVDRCDCFETCDLLQSHGGSSLYSVYYKHL